MAFQNKTDYCGLVAATTPSGGTAKLVIRTDAENASNQKYQPMGEDGSFVGTEVFGADESPANTYGLAGAITATAGSLKLGKLTTIGTGDTAKNYALESVTFTSNAGQAVAVSATCQLVESSATDANQCHYSVPAFSITTKHHAQDVFSAFTLSGDGCELTSCTAVASCTVGKDKVAGVNITSDINSGVITVSGTILQSKTTSPTITVEQNSGWVITKPPTATNPETAYKSYPFEVQKVLAKDVVVQQTAG